MSINAYSEYLKEIKGRPIAHIGVDEETAPDIAVATTTTEKPTQPLDEIELERFDSSIDFRLFIDGVQRTTPIKTVVVGDGLEVPIHLIQCVAGVCKREKGRIRPLFYKGPFQILALPLRAIKEVEPEFPKPNYEELGPQASLYDFLVSEPSRPLWVDTSVTFSSFGKSNDIEDYSSSVEGRELVCIGELKKRARDKATVIMRILELGVLMEVRKSLADEWVILDGPIAPLLKYSGDISAELAGVQNIADPHKSYEFLRRVVGALKIVQIVPDKGLNIAFNRKEGRTRIPLYIMADQIKGVDAVGRTILSAYVWLRGELSKELTSIWSPVSGLARFDIPFPAFVDREEYWYKPDYKPRLSDNLVRSRIKDILISLVSERWPYPPAWGSRALVELYPIMETESWLHSLLTPSQELSRLVE